MNFSKIFSLFLSSLVIPTWIGAQEPPRVLEDRNGYFKLEGLTASWTSEAVGITDSDMENLEVSPPALEIQVKVTPTSKVPGSWEVGWVLVVEEHYSFTGWKNSRRETRYPRLPFNRSEAGSPFFIPPEKKVTASSAPFSLDLTWNQGEKIPLKEEGNRDPAALGSILRQQGGSLYLVGYNSAANLAVVAAEVRFSQAWEVYVDGFLPPGNRAQPGEQVFLSPVVLTPGNIKLLPGNLMLPGMRGAPEVFVEKSPG